MITRCPSCYTQFRVHAEQLAMRAGQVRCGKCSRIFDALEYLMEETAPAPLELDSVANPGMEVQEPPSVASAEVEAQATDNEAAVSEAAITTPEQPASVEAETKSFDFGPIAAADPAKRLRRWPWLLGAFLLLLLLLVQATYQYRSAIIVLFPDVKPYAAELCATLGCELPLPRRIELISIDASDLQADTTNPNIMVLTATLKNRAIFNQQLPLLELTLTNSQDHPVVRRVLTPQDYIGKAANAEAGFAANTELVIKVFIEGSRLTATGYRLYLFYP